MLDAAPSATMFTSAVFVRHDLMMEMGRLESLMETASHHEDGSCQSQVDAMRQRHGRIAEALCKLPV